MSTTKRSARLVKNFFGNNLHVFLELSKSGGLSGVLFQGPGKPFEHEVSLTGMYHHVNKKICLTFFTTFAEISTCYAGEIVKYNDDEECLLLRFLQTNESIPGHEGFSNNEHLALFDSPKKDRILKARKVLQNFFS